MGLGFCRRRLGNAPADLVVRVIRVVDGMQMKLEKGLLNPVTKETAGEYDFYFCTTDEKHGQKLEEVGFKQDPDVLDTWFSSWLWPFATMGWPENTETLKKFYPT